MADNIDITPGTGKTILTDDCTTGHAQVVKLAISTDGAATLIPADAANGIDVDVTRLPAVTNAGTFAVQDSEKIADNAAFVDGTTKLLPVGYILDETAGTSLTENDIAAARVDAKRAQVFVIEDRTTRAQRAIVSTSGSLQVDPQGNVAHDAVDSGSPVKVGARAAALAASVTLVAASDRVDNTADLDGAQIVRHGCQLGDIISDTKTDTGGTSVAFTGSFAATVNVRNYVSCVAISNTSATAVTVDLRDGTGGAVLFTFMVPAGGGIVVPFSPPLRQPTVNTALAMDGSAAATTITVSVNGFKSKA